MYRIAVLTSSRAQEAFLAEQISRFCAEHCLFPKMDCYHDQESFFEAARNEPLTNAVIALPGVDGLNAVEHLRALCPQTRIIWCSDLDFFAPCLPAACRLFSAGAGDRSRLAAGIPHLAGWKKNQAEQHWSDRNEHNKENCL